jgi:hypothetical protein
MYKLILKSADKTLETRILPDHAAAVAAWREMRAKPLEGQAVDLVACWCSRIFLRHRFSAGPEDMYHIPTDAPISQFFFQGAAGEAVVMRPAGRPPKDSAEARDWSSVDWTRRDAEIARELGVSRQTAATQRKRHEGK